jgi:hypothetical protein
VSLGGVVSIPRNAGTPETLTFSVGDGKVENLQDVCPLLDMTNMDRRPGGDEVAIDGIVLYFRVPSGLSGR